MKEESIHIEYESLIVRYLTGEANDKEQWLLLQWLKESPDNMKEFIRLRQVSDVCNVMSKDPDFHLDEALDNFKKQTQIEPNQNPFSVKKTNPFNRTIWIAASVAAVLLIAFSLKIFNSHNQQILIAKSGEQKLQIVLADGSKAILSKNAKIFTSKKFNKNHRVIALQGEVFFQVKHDDVHPFTIKTNNITITDIGTAFKVNTDSITKNSFVVVEEGIVRINYFKQECVLHAGEYAKTDASKKRLIITLNKSKSKTTSKNELVFEDTPLDEVLLEINEHYKTNFVLASSNLNDYKLNASFDNNTNVQQIKELLSVVLNVKIQEKKGKLLIYTDTDSQ